MKAGKIKEKEKDRPAPPSETFKSTALGRGGKTVARGGSMCKDQGGEFGVCAQGEELEKKGENGGGLIKRGGRPE